MFCVFLHFYFHKVFLASPCEWVYNYIYKVRKELQILTKKIFQKMLALPENILYNYSIRLEKRKVEKVKKRFQKTS